MEEGNLQSVMNREAPPSPTSPTTPSFNLGFTTRNAKGKHWRTTTQLEKLDLMCQLATGMTLLLRVLPTRRDL